MEEALDKTQASQLKGQSEPTERDFWLHLKALLSRLSAVGLTRGKTLQADDIKKIFDIISSMIFWASFI